MTEISRFFCRPGRSFFVVLTGRPGRGFQDVPRGTGGVSRFFDVRLQPQAGQIARQAGSHQPGMAPQHRDHHRHREERPPGVRGPHLPVRGPTAGGEPISTATSQWASVPRATSAGGIRGVGGQAWVQDGDVGRSSAFTLILLGVKTERNGVDWGPMPTALNRFSPLITTAAQDLVLPVAEDSP